MSARLENVLDIAGADDWYDPWGTAMALHFDIAAVLDMAQAYVREDITTKPFARWQYHRAAARSVPALEDVAARADDFAEGEWADDYTYGTVMLAAALYAEQISAADLIYAGDVLAKYTHLLELAGKSY